MTVTVLALLTVICVQYVRVIERNVALARSLAAINREVAALRSEREERLAHIRRLEDPQGAIPEIHDRLHMLKPNETIIYWKGATPAPEVSP